MAQVLILFIYFADNNVYDFNINHTLFFDWLTLKPSPPTLVFILVPLQCDLLAIGSISFFEKCEKYFSSPIILPNVHNSCILGWAAMQFM